MTLNLSPADQEHTYMSLLKAYLHMLVFNQVINKIILFFEKSKISFARLS